MNKLADSPSLYLRQHANNPVDWYPWGKEAIALAKKEDKPIFLSIGYSTCYWCHVMEREIFEKPEIAKLMNRDFINIKVDREERPDIDDIYMSARQVITREGGWPNNLFLTPDLKPFFGGGTYAAEGKYGRPGFPEVLDMVTQSWKIKRDEIEEAAENITKRVVSIQKIEASKGVKVTGSVPEELARHLGMVHDPSNGGFYQQPKFPHESYILFLLDYYRASGDQKALKIATRSLDMMASGGIFDHVGGGFHRYSVDAKWQVPHFEKMLYNQALMAQAYTKAFEITGKPYYEYIARSTLDFVETSMTGRRGQFYSAYDAETDGVEGEYYVWSEQELKNILTSGAINFLKEVYDFADLPHFEGHKSPDGKVLYAKKPLPDMASDRGESYDDLQQDLDKVLGKLLAERSSRQAPALDQKVIGSWNGMMITAFAEAGRVFDDKSYVDKALNASNFIIKNMMGDDYTLARIWSDERVSVDGFLDDYANIVQGFLSVSRVTGDKKWIRIAIDIINRADDLYYDGPPSRPKTGGFFYTRDAKDLIVKIKSGDDSAIPSANSVMVHALADMGELTKGTEWEHEVWSQRANETINIFANQINASPEYYVHMVHGMLKLKGMVDIKQALSRSSSPKSTMMGSDEKKLSSASYVKVLSKWEKKKIKPGDEVRLDVTLKIADGWHVNSNSPQLDFLIPTSIDVRGDLSEMIHVKYPETNNSIQFNTGGNIDTYEDEIKISALVKIRDWAKAGDFIALNLLVTYQVCNSETCLQPVDQLIELPVIVAGG